MQAHGQPGRSPCASERYQLCGSDGTGFGHAPQSRAPCPQLQRQHLHQEGNAGHGTGEAGFFCKRADTWPVVSCLLSVLFSRRSCRLWDTWGACRWSTLATVWCALREPLPLQQSSERDCQSSGSVHHLIPAFYVRQCHLCQQYDYLITHYLFSGAQSVIWWDHRGSSSCCSSSRHRKTSHWESGFEW